MDTKEEGSKTLNTLLCSNVVVVFGQILVLVDGPDIQCIIIINISFGLSFEGACRCFLYSECVESLSQAKVKFVDVVSIRLMKGKVDFLGCIDCTEIGFSLRLTSSFEVFLQVRIGKSRKNSNDDHYNHHFHQAESVKPFPATCQRHAKTMAH